MRIRLESQVEPHVPFGQEQTQMRHAILAFSSITAASILASAHGQTCDGFADVVYGEPLVVQDTSTGFGNADLGAIDFANGSEVDAAFGYIADGVLHLVIAGNLESNYNKLEIFIDAIPDEGQNPILGNNSGIDFGALNTMGRFEDPDTGEVQPGLTFDTGFTADHWISFTGGPGAPPKKGGEPGYDTYLNYSQLLTGGGDTATSGFAGPGGAGADGALFTENGIIAAIDNSNVLGVVGGDGVDDGGGVFTGIEIHIPLEALGHTAGDPILVSAFINGSGHDFISNQVLGGLGGSANLGFPRFVNFEDIDGDQFFLVDGGGSGGGCFGDLNDDGQVDGADFGSLLASWGPCPSCPADLNDDGVVDGADVGLMLSVWGPCP